MILYELRNAVSVWPELDRLATDPLCACLRRVDLKLSCFDCLDDDNFDDDFKAVLAQKLLLLHSKGILDMLLYY